MCVWQCVCVSVLICVSACVFVCIVYCVVWCVRLCILVSLGVYLFVGESWQLGQEIRDSGHCGRRKSLQHAKAPGKRGSLEGENHDDGQRKVNRG